MDLETRVACLEKQNRRLRSLLTLVLILAMAPLLLSWTQGVPDQIKAKKFTLVNNKGEETGTWIYHGKEGCKLSLEGPRATATLTPWALNIETHDKGKHRQLLFLKPDTGISFVWGSEEEKLLYGTLGAGGLRVDSPKGYVLLESDVLGFASTKHKHRVSLQAKEPVSTFALFDNMGKVVFGVPKMK